MIPVIDLHADTYMKKDIFNTLPWLRKAYFKIPTRPGEEVQFSETITPERIVQGNVRLQVQSLFISDLGVNNPLHNGLKMLANIKRDVKADESSYQFYTVNDFNDNLDKYGTMVSIEGLEPINNDLELLDIYYELGVRMLAPTWNRALPYVGSSAEPYGILAKGRELAKKLNELGLIFDVAHISDQGFWDFMNQLDCPVIASHSNYRKVCNHPRNLTGEQIKEISNRDGVIGINFYPSFLCSDKNYNIDSDYPEGYSLLYNMIEVIVDEFGDDVIAFGSDFDGISVTPEGVESPAFFQDFAKFLKHRSVSQNTIEKLFYKNALRVLSCY